MMQQNPEQQKTPTSFLSLPLGSCSWKLLHTIVEHYPKQPSDTEKNRITQFMDGFGHLYPCEHCQEDFVDILKKNPIQNNSRKELCLWMCKIHNEVNKATKKELIDSEKLCNDLETRMNSIEIKRAQGIVDDDDCKDCDKTLNAKQRAMIKDTMSTFSKLNPWASKK